MRIFLFIFKIWSSFCFREIKTIILRKYYNNSFSILFILNHSKIILPKKNGVYSDENSPSRFSFFLGLLFILENKNFYLPWISFHYFGDKIVMFERLCSFNYHALLQRKIFKDLLTILTGKKSCLTESSTKIHWNTRLAASDVFYILALSLKFF